MTNVVSFPCKGRVEIHYGKIVSSTMATASGVVRVPNDEGTMRFFVDVVEANGRIGMWDGTSYEEAIRQAYDLAEDYGPVFDLVAGDAS